MTSGRQQLLDLIEDKDCFNKPHAELLPLQLKAAQDLFAERRTQIRVLDRRARETGVEKIEKQEDIVPLLFAHTTYKAFPQSFIQNGQWDRMTKWLGTLSVAPMDEVDDSNVADIDEWLERLWAAGHEVNTTSGASGKVSILNRTKEDDTFRAKCTECATCWPNPLSGSSRSVTGC